MAEFKYDNWKIVWIDITEIIFFLEEGFIR